MYSGSFAERGDFHDSLAGARIGVGPPSVFLHGTSNGADVCTSELLLVLLRCILRAGKEAGNNEDADWRYRRSRSHGKPPPCSIRRLGDFCSGFSVAVRFSNSGGGLRTDGNAK